MYVWCVSQVCVFHEVHVEVQEQCLETGSLLPLCIWVLNPGHHVCNTSVLILLS